MFDIFRAKKKRAVDALGRTMADEFIQRYSLDMHKSDKSQKTTRRLTQAIAALCTRARQFLEAASSARSKAAATAGTEQRRCPPHRAIP
ncbi:MAG: hypothetical protein GKR94_25555 [Gammaproteobacteria bacterium]|nr:hypothetical protein [Gammaproteobacteria bacterium]